MESTNSMKLVIYTADVTGSEKNCLYPHRQEVTTPEELMEVIRHDHVCAQYEGNYRSNKNFRSANCLVMDVDNDHSDNPEEWITPEKLSDEYTGLKYAITFSRHHMKEKEGKSARPRFHVYFQIAEQTDADAYKAIKTLIRAQYPFYDGNALDAGRFIYGSESENVIWHDGETTIDRLFAAAQRGSTYTIPEGQRNATMSRFAGRLVKRYGWNETSHAIFLEQAEKCDPPLDDEELSKIWNSAKRFAKEVACQPGYVPPEEYNPVMPPGKPGCLMPEDYTDMGEAAILAKTFEDRLCFNPATGYFHYNGVHWVESDEAALGGVMDFLNLQLADALALLFTAEQALLNSGASEDALKGGKKELAKLNEEQKRLMAEYAAAEKYLGFVMQRRNYRNIVNTMNSAKPLLTVELSQLNADPYLLNTPEATYRLQDGLAGRQEHAWNDFITKVTPVEPGEQGKELWEDALHKTFLGDRELIDYVQEVVGLAAIGKVCKEAMIIAYGDGRNGKSTFWNTISKVLGGYSGNVSADTLTMGCRRNVKPEMAELKGVRLALARELEEGMRLNTSTVKQLTSTDDIFGEKKYCKPASFTPSHTLVLYTNHLPRVGATDEGTWRRLIVIPFNAVFEGKADVKNYSNYLFENAAPAVLAWVIEGAKRVIAKDFHLKNPEIVQNAIDEYRQENDWFAAFAEDCLEIDPDYTEKSGELYTEYRAYCMRIGEFARSTTEFYRALSSRGFTKQKKRTGMLIVGLRLKSDFLNA